MTYAHSLGLEEFSNNLQYYFDILDHNFHKESW